jgi:hypothetical protein
MIQAFGEDLITIDELRGRMPDLPPRPESPVAEPVHGRIRRRPVLGGLINEYKPAA